MATQAVVKANTIRALLAREDVKKQIGMAIPKHLTVDRLLRVAMTSIQRNPQLLDCTPQSLLACVMTCAQLGLEPDGFTGQAYLVPFKNHGVLEAQLIPGYRGLLALARRSGEIQSVQSQVVYTKDMFKLRYGLEEQLDHEPADGDRGNPKGAYVVFRYKDGSRSFDYMSATDIEKIRARSKSPNNGPWVTDWDEMGKKTVIRRHSKLAPMSIEFQRATALEDRFHAGESQMDLLTENGDAIDVQPEEVKETEEELTAKVAKFNLLIPKKVVEDGSMEEFIRLTAEANQCEADDVKVTAMDDFEGFWRLFEKWYDGKKKGVPRTKAQQPEQPPQTV